MEGKPKIALCTTAFPYLHAEFPFISNEFEYLQEHTDVGVIFTHSSDSNLGFKVLGSIQVIVENDLKAVKRRTKYFVRFLLKILIPMVFTFVAKRSVKGKISLSEVKNLVSQYLKYFKTASQINPILQEQNISVIYSYWFDHWNAVACITKAVFNSKLTVASRAHRYEIDFEKNPNNFIGFRSFQFKHTDRVCFISNTWMGLIKARFAKHSANFFYRPMGVSFADGFEPLVVSNKAPYHLLSISRHIPLKRLKFLASVLSKLNEPIVWHHFGEPNKNNELSYFLKNSEVEYKCYGFVSTSKLLAFMESNSIHFLLNASTIEGVPVSMMESLSRGIPVIATDVGGVSEIVNRTNGYLVKSDITENNFVVQLKGWLEDYRFGDKEKRKEIIHSAFEKFDKHKNYLQFCEELNQLTNS